MQTGYPRFFISLNIRKVSGFFFFTSAAPHSANFFFVMLHVAFCPLRTKVRHTFRELPTNPLPQIRRGVPRIPSRTRRPRARRAALHLRPPLHLPGAVPSGQGQHCQAILAAHRSRHLEPASYAVPHCPRTRLVTHLIDSPASQAGRAPALRLLQTGTRTVVWWWWWRRAARGGPVCVSRATLWAESGRRGGRTGQGRDAPPHCG